MEVQLSTAAAATAISTLRSAAEASPPDEAGVLEACETLAAAAALPPDKARTLLRHVSAPAAIGSTLDTLQAHPMLGIPVAALLSSVTHLLDTVPLHGLLRFLLASAATAEAEGCTQPLVEALTATLSGFATDDVGYIKGLLTGGVHKALATALRAADNDGEVLPLVAQVVVQLLQPTHVFASDAAQRLQRSDVHTQLPRCVWAHLATRPADQDPLEALGGPIPLQALACLATLSPAAARAVATAGQSAGEPGLWTWLCSVVEGAPGDPPPPPVLTAAACSLLATLLQHLARAPDQASLEGALPQYAQLRDVVVLHAGKPAAAAPLPGPGAPPSAPLEPAAGLPQPEAAPAHVQCLRVSVSVLSVLGAMAANHSDEALTLGGLHKLTTAVARDACSQTALYELLFGLGGSGPVLLVRCLQNIDEGIMLSAARLLAVLLQRDEETAPLPLVWALRRMVLSTDGTEALLGCAADYNADIRRAAYACLAHLAQDPQDSGVCALEPCAWQPELVAVLPLPPLRALAPAVAPGRLLSPVLGEVREWLPGGGLPPPTATLHSALQLLAALAAHPSALDSCVDGLMAALPPLVTLLLTAGQRCWVLAKLARRRRRRQSGEERRGGPQASSSCAAHAASPTSRSRRRRSGSSPGSALPGLPSPSHLGSASPSLGPAPAPSTTSPRQEADASDEAEGAGWLSSPAEVAGAPDLLCASLTALGNLVYRRAVAGGHAVAAGALPLLLRLLAGSTLEAAYEGGKWRAERDGGLTGQPGGGWTPLVDGSHDAVVAELAMPCAGGQTPADALAQVRAAESRGCCLPAASAARTSALQGALTALVNLVDGSPLCKRQIATPLVASLLPRLLQHPAPGVGPSAALLLSHLSIGCPPMSALLTPPDTAACLASALTALLSHPSGAAVPPPAHSNLPWLWEGGEWIWGATDRGVGEEGWHGPDSPSHAPARLQGYMQGAFTLGEQHGDVAPGTSSGHSPESCAGQDLATLMGLVNWAHARPEAVSALAEVAAAGRIAEVLILNVRTAQPHLLALEAQLEEATHEGLLPAEPTPQDIAQALPLDIAGPYQVIAAALLALGHLTSPGTARAADHAEGLVAAGVVPTLVQLVTDIPEDTVSKRAFAVLENAGIPAVQALLGSLVAACDVLGVRDTLPADELAPLLAAAGAPTQSDTAPGIVAAAARWAGKCLAVLNGLVFTSTQATTWLSRQRVWWGGLLPLARVMLAQVPSDTILHAALLGDNLASAGGGGSLQAFAAELHLLPLLATLLHSVAGAAGTADDEAAASQARALLLSFVRSLCRHHRTNCAEFVDSAGGGGLSAVLASLHSPQPDAEAAVECLLVLAEAGAEEVRLQAAAAAAAPDQAGAGSEAQPPQHSPVQPATLSNAFTTRIKAADVTQALGMIQEAAGGTMTGLGARAAQCIADLAANGFTVGHGLPLHRG